MIIEVKKGMTQEEIKGTFNFQDGTSFKQKGMTQEEIKALLSQKRTAKKGLQKHVGKLKRGLDGLSYQKEIRNDWVGSPK